MSNIKMAIIGGGSSYTPELVDGILQKFDSFPVHELYLVDIPSAEKKLNTVLELTKRMFKKAGRDVKVYASFDRRKALDGCAYVITQFRAGGLESRAKDERIPLEYGFLGQETTGAGGFAKALRTVPIALSIAHDMEELCPDAWLINFTNPSGLITEAILRFSNTRCVGLCNVPINMHRHLAEHLDIKPDKLYTRFVGLNHLSFIDQVIVDGQDKLDQWFEDAHFVDYAAKALQNQEGAKALVQRLRLIPSYYLYYYYYEKEAILKEQQDIQSGKGTRAQQVMEVEKQLFDIYADTHLDHKPEQLSKRGGSLYSEAALSLMNSIHNNLGEIHVVNCLNRGAITDLPFDCVIETNCFVDQSGAHPLTSGPLPTSVTGLVNQVKTYERYTIEAAIEGSLEKAYLALLNHPLIHGASVIPQLLESLLEANRQFLPQFYKETPST